MAQEPGRDGSISRTTKQITVKVCQSEFIVHPYDKLLIPLTLALKGIDRVSVVANGFFLYRQIILISICRLNMQGTSFVRKDRDTASCRIQLFF